MGALGLNLAFVGRNIAANVTENSVGGWLQCIHSRLRPGVAAARSALVRAPAATALSRRTLPAPVLIFPTNLNRATNGFVTAVSRVLLGGK